jgi:hypothetical protein
MLFAKVLILSPKRLHGLRLRHLLRHSEGVRSAEILEVLERHGV